jgi:hypothetical protein
MGKENAKRPQLLQDALAAELTENLYHYTPQAGLLGIVESQSIWASNIQYLNDAQEARLAFSIMGEAVNGRLRRDKPELGDVDRGGEIWGLLTKASQQIGHIVDLEVYACCFSSARDQLSQWRGYAGEGGFALAFKPTAIDTIIHNNQMRMIKCIYDQTKNREIAEAIIDSTIATYDALDKASPQEREALAVEHFKENFLLWVPMCKHPGFSEEGEWRLVVFPDGTRQNGDLKHRASRYCIVGYREVRLALDYGRRTEGRLDLGFHDLLVGPSPIRELPGNSAWNMVTRSGIYIEQVSPSGIPFRPI